MPYGRTAPDTPRATTAVILARGLGSRMRSDDGAVLTPAQQAAAASGAKGLMPIGGHALLDHVLHELAEGGVSDVVFVVAPDETALRARYGRERPPRRLQVHFAEQAEPRGTADALHAAESMVQSIGLAADDGQRHFLMCNADNLYPAESIRALVDLDGPGLIAYDADALVRDGNIDADRVLSFALLDLMADGSLKRVVEKPGPEHPLVRAHPRWVSMNLWRFTSSIFAHCAAVRPSVRNELELVDAVRDAIARGERFQAVRQQLPVLDLSRRGDVASVEARLAGRVPVP